MADWRVVFNRSAKYKANQKRGAYSAARLNTLIGFKKRGPRLGSGASESAFRCQCRFHTDAWGHPS
jgi:hypothetical protein